MKLDACMMFYDENEPQYLETDAFGVGLGVGLLQIREKINCPYDEAPDNTVLHPTAFASKSLPTAKPDTAALRGKHSAYYMDWKKIYHYCFAIKVSIITDQKSLVSISKKDVETFSLCLQCILLHKH